MNVKAQLKEQATDREIFLAGLKSLQSVEISKTPNYMLMILLRDTLTDLGFSLEVANIVVTSIKIEVNSNFMNDKELVDEVLSTFGNTLIEIDTQSKIDNFANILINIASRMTIAYNI